MITPLTTEQEINDFVQSKVDEFIHNVVQALCYVGEKCINKARRKHPNNYKNRTGNLRSSVGYVVAVAGQVVTENFTGKTEGASAGKNAAREALKNYPNDIVLVLVAGMEYAVHVHNLGYDVLTGAMLWAEAKLPKLLKGLTE